MRNQTRVGTPSFESDGASAVEVVVEPATVVTAAGTVGSDPVFASAVERTLKTGQLSASGFLAFPGSVSEG